PVSSLFLAMTTGSKYINITGATIAVKYLWPFGTKWEELDSNSCSSLGKMASGRCECASVVKRPD
ncbi:9254_t:CDS:2, partial [Acaulospora colombiana]